MKDVNKKFQTILFLALILLSCNKKEKELQEVSFDNFGIDFPFTYTDSDYESLIIMPDAVVFNFNFKNEFSKDKNRELIKIKTIANEKPISLRVLEFDKNKIAAELKYSDYNSIFENDIKRINNLRDIDSIFLDLSKLDFEIYYKDNKIQTSKSKELNGSFSFLNGYSIIYKIDSLEKKKISRILISNKNEVVSNTEINF